MTAIKTAALFIALCCCKIGFSQTTPPPPPADTTIEEKIFTRVEQEAEFPGGLKGWKTFIVKTLNADVPGDNGAPAGRYTVIAKFIVSKTGSISDVIAETSEGYGMETEVIRTIKNSGNWIPAYQNGRRVNAYRRQPITFLVQDDDYDITTATPYILFAGIDNSITISSGKIKMEDVKVTISKGTITPNGNGKFTVNFTGKGRVVIALIDTKTNKPIGSSSFEVKQ